MLKKILGAAVILLLVIQLFPNKLPENELYNPNDLIRNNPIPKEIEGLLKNTCYDCHSNKTVYPWYSRVAPISYLVKYKIKEGREHLNFSEWESLSKLEKVEKLDDIIEEVEEGKMPLNIYLITHPRAQLSIEEQGKISSWAEEFSESIFAN